MNASIHSRRALTIGLLGFLLAFPCIAAGGYLYLRYGDPPVATADKPFPYEKTIVHIPLNARIDRQLTQPPFVPTADDLASGAHLYVEHCAMCHGTPDHDSSFGKWEYPTSPQLWKKKSRGRVGVSDDPVSVSYWKVDNGIRLTGMPSFNHILTERQMWQVSFLVARADQPLSPAVASTLEAADAKPGNESGLQPASQMPATSR